MKMLFITAAIFLLCINLVPAQETTTEPQTDAATAPQTASFETGMQRYRQKRYREAIAEFERVVQADPTNAAAHYFLGYAHYVMDRHKEALAAFARAFEADPAFDPKPYFRK